MTTNSMNMGANDTGHPMDFLLTEEFSLNVPAAGEIRKGRVVASRNNEILIDIGAKSEGIITGAELEAIDEDIREQAFVVGNEISVYIVDPEDRNGNIILSYKKASEEQDWAMAAKLLKNEETYQSKIIGYNRGGLLVQVGLIRGFVPNSQLRHRINIENDSATRNSQKLVGQTIYAKVIEVDRKRNRLILSEKAADQEIRAIKRADLLAKIQEGDVHKGKVVNLTNYGAFVDIGGIEGLVHLSELSWKRIEHPTEKVQVGDKVDVQVLQVDQEQQRIALSIKRLEPDPWSVIDEYYQVGQLIGATVTKITKFGAFARLNDEFELQGLIHISELSENHINHPQEAVKPSENVTVRIIRIDPEQRQLGLSIKQVTSDKFLDIDLAAMAEDNIDEPEAASELEHEVNFEEAHELQE